MPQPDAIDIHSPPLVPARDPLAPARDPLVPARDPFAPARDPLAPAREAALAAARSAQRWGGGCTALLMAVAGAVEGASAAAAAGIGGAIGLLAGRSLVTGLVAAVSREGFESRTVNRALLAALLRYPLLGGALAAAILVLGLPVHWLAAGVTAWPVSLVAAACAAAAWWPSAAELPHPEADVTP